MISHGNRTTYVYDLAGQRVQRQYPNGNRTMWTYDPVGNPLVIESTAGTFTRTFDPLNEVVQLVWPTDDVLTWTYDAAGNRRTRVTEQGTTTYTYDANARLTKLVNEHAEVTTFVYDASGREIEKQLDNETRTSLTYDPAGQIVTIVQADDSGTPFLTLEYQYDAVGNRTSLVETDALSAQQSTLWSYDVTSQLLSEAKGVDSVEVSRTTFVYDPVGNRLVREIDSDRTTSTYDAANRLLTAEEFSGVTTYTYDANGNQRSVEIPVGDVTTYTWSYENQLIGVEQPADVVTTYAYAPVNKNSDELRFSKETDAGTVQFVWDNQNIIRELDETGLVEAEYTLNPQPYGDLVSQHQDAESTFYHFDALGSTRVLTDGNAVETDTYFYTAFGQLESSTGSTPNEFTYVGELGYYFDEETGQISIRWRQYGPDQNRFTSEDPILFASGTTGLYEYGGNNPVNAVDPSGLEIEGIDFADLDDGVSAVLIWGILIAEIDFNSKTVCRRKGMGGSSRDYCVPLDQFSKALGSPRLVGQKNWEHSDWNRWFEVNDLTTIRNRPGGDPIFDNVFPPEGETMSVGDLCRAPFEELLGRADHLLSNVLEMLEKAGREAASIGLGFTPVVGELLDVFAVIAGKDSITQEELTLAAKIVTVVLLAVPFLDRKFAEAVLSLLGAGLARLGAEVKCLGEGATWLVKNLQQKVDDLLASLSKGPQLQMAGPQLPPGGGKQPNRGGGRGRSEQAPNVGAPSLVSRIKESPRLVRGAESAGKSAQESIDKLTKELARGNLNPGIGTKPIGRGISEARARDGARVYFRQLQDGTIEILGKSTKANQSTVIEEVLKRFGG